jgi:hypothetical protein
VLSGFLRNKLRRSDQQLKFRFAAQPIRIRESHEFLLRNDIDLETAPFLETGFCVPLFSFVLLSSFG